MDHIRKIDYHLRDLVSMQVVNKLASGASGDDGVMSANIPSKFAGAAGVMFANIPARSSGSTGCACAGATGIIGVSCTLR